MTPAMRAAVLERDGHRCQFYDCPGTHMGWSVHHRKLRSQGGRDEMSNLITLCGSGSQGCHALVHSRRKDVGELFGYLVPSWGDPVLVPVRTPGGLVLLTADGLRVSA